jgi:two-component system response regulator
MAADAILIVEDDLDDLELIQRALRKSRVNNTTVVARDGEEALRLLLDGPERLEPLPLVVFLDIKLPRVDGLEVLARLRGEIRTKSLPVVILTSSDQQEDLLRSYDLGANSFVRKPIEFAAFQKTVAQLGLYWLLINRNPRPA